MYSVYKIAKIVRKIMPYGLYCKFVGDSYSKEIGRLKKDIWRNKDLYAQYKTEIDYMKEQGRLCAFPYSFQEKYKGLKTAVFYDTEGWGYVMHSGKKLFFPKRWKESRIRSCYNALLAEQDKESPHCYFTDTFSFARGGYLST